MLFFSVIIPTYNRRDFLKRAVESVLKQSFSDFELIVIDDGSDDQSNKMLLSFCDKRLIYKFQPHQGVSAARNFGIKTAAGEFIAFLDSDDRFDKDKLKITYDYIKKFPQFKIFHTEEIWYRNKEHLNPKAIHQKPEGFVFEKALKLCCIGMSTCVVKMEIFEDIRLFDEQLPVCEDYDFWLRTAVKYPIKLIPLALTSKDGGHEDQLSKKFPAMDTFRIYAIKKLLDQGKLNPEQKEAAIKELKRKCTIYIKGAKKRNKTKEVEYYNSLILSYESM